MTATYAFWSMSSRLCRTVSWYEIEEGGSLPWYMGLAYERVMQHQIVIAVVPVNRLIRWVREGWFWVRNPRRLSRREQMEFRIRRAETVIRRDAKDDWEADRLVEGWREFSR